MESIATNYKTKPAQSLRKNEKKILFTSSIYPYPTLPNDTSLTDATGARFTRADGIFCILSHSHHFANHVLAQNIQTPSVILEYPRWEHFTNEVKKRYDIIGISALPVHLENVLKMCAYIREHSPATKILLGCYAGLALNAVYPNEEWKKYVDEICHGEGVEFMRRLLGEDTNRPIQQKLMPKGGGSPRFITKFPKGAIGFLVSGLGCPGNCDFCSSTAFYKRRRIEMLSPADLVEHMYLYKKNFPDVTNVFVIEEDHFRWPEYLINLREPWERHPDMVECLDWFAFGSLDFIGSFVQKYGWDAILEIGIGVMFIGVESKFADLLHYKKRSKTDPREVFSQLHKRGIRTVGSWVCGWDFHNHTNIEEDLNYFVALNPTYQQLTRLSPFPGTALWYQLKEEGRLKDVPWEDMHFWSGTQKNLGLEEHETLNIVEHGYDLLYRTWGPSLLRRLDVQLDGYAYCLKSSNRILRDHKSVFFKKQCGMLWTLLTAIERFAPNGIVRRKVQQIGKKYIAVIGEPTPIMQYLSKKVLRLATREYMNSIKNPAFVRPKIEPTKKYCYTKSNNGNGDIPYSTEWLTNPSFKVGKDMAIENLRYFALERVMKVKRLVSRDKFDPVIDGYLLGMVERKAFGFGL